METLGDAFPGELARMRECLKNGREIMPSGAFYCLVVEDVIRRAEQAQAERDPVAMLRVFYEMRDIKE